MLERLHDTIEMGGFVMPPLLVIGLLLWTLIGLRMQLLERGFGGTLAERVRRIRGVAETLAGARGLLDRVLRTGLARLEAGPAGRRGLDQLVLEVDMELGRYRRVIRSLCGVAPLLGLLGTVSGMIETFHGLTAMELFASDGGVAGGVAEALVSTQMGLVVAVPGLIASRLLDGREEALRLEVRRAREHLDLSGLAATGAGAGG